MRSLSTALAATLLVSAFANVVVAETISGRVTHVRDGDTIVVESRPIRLDALNCEEKRTKLGQAAKAAMSKLVAGKVVICDLDGGRTWDRETGRCSIQGKDIGRIMIESGLCGRCAAYDPGRSYVFSQSQAKRFKGTVPDYCRVF